jgi:hypothetical protein
MQLLKWSDDEVGGGAVDASMGGTARHLDALPVGGEVGRVRAMSARPCLVANAIVVDAEEDADVGTLALPRKLDDGDTSPHFDKTPLRVSLRSWRAAAARASIAVAASGGVSTRCARGDAIRCVTFARRACVCVLASRRLLTSRERKSEKRLEFGARRVSHRAVLLF